MDEYADWIESSLRTCDARRVARQKEIEERIEVPFCYDEAHRASAAEAGRRSSAGLCEKRPERRSITHGDNHAHGIR
jgi:hypothetical protein